MFPAKTEGKKGGGNAYIAPGIARKFYKREEKNSMKIRRRTILKLSGKYFNNLYLGGPKGPDAAEAAEKAAEKSASDATKNVEMYVMWKDYISETPTPPEPPVLSGANNLPAQADQGNTNGLPNYCSVGVTQSNLAKCIKARAFNALFQNPDVIDATDYEGVVHQYLQSFTRNGVLYGPEGNYFYANSDHSKGDAVPDGQSLVDGDEYYWAGWGLMYNPGVGAPATTAGFTEKTLDQQLIANGDKYTIIYAKTEYQFIYHEAQEKGIHLILRDIVENVEDIADEALAESRRLYEEAKEGVVELVERL